MFFKFSHHFIRICGVKLLPSIDMGSYELPNTSVVYALTRSNTKLKLVTDVHEINSSMQLRGFINYEPGFEIMLNNLFPFQCTDE